MGAVRLFMSMSLDGFVADHGRDSSALYPDLADLRNTEALAEMIETTGAVVMGRRSYDMGDTDEGYVDYEHQVPIFVLTHRVPEVPARHEPTKRLTFTFVTDGVESEVPEGLPHAGDYALDAVARQLLIDAWEARARTGGSLNDVKVVATGGEPHWGGAGDVMVQFIEPFMVKRGVPIGSGKRTPAENAACGGSDKSDHLTTRTTCAARDFKTFDGEDDARALAKALGCDSWRPNSYDGFTLSVDNHTFRAQILWGGGIDHSDHVHVGVTAA